MLCEASRIFLMLGVFLHGLISDDEGLMLWRQKGVRWFEATEEEHCLMYEQLYRTGKL